ncbi:MAG: hypothetical protein ACK5N0_10080 [Synechococcaceae cyanobacterium]
MLEPATGLLGRLKLLPTPGLDRQAWIGRWPRQRKPRAGLRAAPRRRQLGSGQAGHPG